MRSKICYYILSIKKAADQNNRSGQLLRYIGYLYTIFVYTIFTPFWHEIIQKYMDFYIKQNFARLLKMAATPYFMGIY